nr:YicC/YloC family endoribonuclease [Listeria floridensis]
MDWEMLDHYFRFLKKAKERYAIADEISFEALLAQPAFLSVDEAPEVDPELPEILTEVLILATERLDAMRSLEGTELALYFKEHLKKNRSVA